MKLTLIIIAVVLCSMLLIKCGYWLSLPIMGEPNPNHIEHCKVMICDGILRQNCYEIDQYTPRGQRKVLMDIPRGQIPVSARCGL